MSEAVDPAKAATTLMQALSSTFADMVFVDVEPAGPSSAGDIQDAVRVAIDVLRPISSRIEIECPASLKARIEATLFQASGPGQHGDESPEDSLLEILNVVAGSFLTCYFGAGADIKLELPRYLFLAEEEGAILAEVSADAEGEPMRAMLRSVRYRY
jgi:hypothetical protein